MSQPDSTPTDDSKPIPGPNGVEMLGRLRRLLTEDTASLLLDTRQRYGRIVELSLPGESNAYLLSDPAYVQHVLETNQGNYRKSEIYRNELSELFGQGLLTSEGDLWSRQHRLIRPMFRSDSVNSFADLITEQTETMLDRWEEHRESGEPIQLLSEMERVTLLIIGRAMFSADMDAHADEIAASLRVLRKRFQRRTSVLPTVPDWVPTPHNRRASDALDQLNGIVYDLIEERRGQVEEYDDLLSMLLAARDEETGEQMDDEQIRDELMTFLLAGHETTAAALTWTGYLLTKNPTVYERLHEYVTKGEKEAEGDTSFVKQCVQEAMRLYPPVPVFAREARETDIIDGYEIPAGSDVLLSQYVVHRDPEVWDEPAAFRPERFAAGTDEERPRYSYFPFGGGARMCIGRQFALMEAQLVLSRVVQRYRLSLQSPTGTPGMSSAVTMIPDEPIEMTVEEW
jgi:cytochrome P450